MYICMVAYIGAVGILPERVVSACSAYLVNCVYRVSIFIYVWLLICIYAWLPIWALLRYCLQGWYLLAALLWLIVCIG